MADKSFASALSALRKNRADAPEEHAQGFRRGSGAFRQLLAARRRLAAGLVEMRGHRKDHGLARKTGRRGGPSRQAQGDALGQAHQHHRGSRRAAHGAAQSRRARASSSRGQDVQARRKSRCSTRWRQFANAVRSGAAKARNRQGDHRCRQYRHRRLGSRAGHGDAGAGALSRRPALALRLQCRRRAYPRHAEGAEAGDDAVHRRLENLHHGRDDDQRRDGAALDRDWHWARTAVVHHFAAVSTALDKVGAFGIAPERVFGFWDWVGGRYSLWSAIGLPIMLAIGPENFRAFLGGANEMDQHFAKAPLLKNLPAIMGLVGYWHRVVCGYPARAVIPYDQRLARLARLSAAARYGIERQERDHRRDGGEDADRPAGLGRAGHQRPARLLPIAASGHGRHSRSSSWRRRRATSRS